jgi:hypothetical protein
VTNSGKCGLLSHCHGEEDRTRYKASLGLVPAVLIMLDQKAFYSVRKFYEDRDVGAILGSGHVTRDVNDHVLGRVFDKLPNAGGKGRWKGIPRALRAHCVAMDSVHFIGQASWRGAYNSQDKTVNMPLGWFSAMARIGDLT